MPNCIDCDGVMVHPITPIHYECPECGMTTSIDHTDEAIRKNWTAKAAQPGITVRYVFSFIEEEDKK